MPEVAAPAKARSGENNGRAKLKEAEVKEIRRLASNFIYNKIPLDLFALHFGVTKKTILKIILRRLWKHI